MNIKKSLIALTIAHAGVVFAHDENLKTGLKLLAGVPAAAVLTEVEDYYLKYAGKRYVAKRQHTTSDFNKPWSDYIAKLTLGAGPAKAQCKLQRAYNIHISPTYEDREHMQKLINSLDSKGLLKSEDIRIIKKFDNSLLAKNSFLEYTIPGTFKKYAFHRNLKMLYVTAGAYYVGKGLYNTVVKK
jgi:hypothetical protein